MGSIFGNAAPIFRVNDVRASLAYYVDILGFTSDWDDGGMASVSRGDCTIFLTSWDQGQAGTWVWIGVKDCDAVCNELEERGAKVRHQSTNFPWAREIQIEDLDGNVLRLGSGPREDEPFGQFLDASGVLWDT